MDGATWVMGDGFVAAGRRLFFVPVPKVASHTILRLLYELEGVPVPERLPGVPHIHARGPGSLPGLASLGDAERIAVLTDPAYLRFTVVRNPYTRLVAAWFGKIWLQSGDALLIQREISRWAGRAEDDPVTFREFVSWLCETQDPQRCDIHWRPMVHLLNHDLIDFDVVGRVEHLVPTLSPVAQHLGLTEVDLAALITRYSGNRSIPFDRRRLYDATVATQVGEFYAADFARYGYALDSWQDMVAERPPSAAELEEAAVVALRRRAATIVNLNRSLSEAWRRTASQSTSSG